MTKILIDEAVVRQALEDFVDIKYGLEKSRIWGGTDWTYNPMHPVHYLPLRDKAEARMESLNQALANASLDKMAENARELGLGDGKNPLWVATHPDQLTTPPAPAPDPDELTIAYMSGVYDGKKRKPWVGLTDEEQTEIMSEAREFVSRGLLDLVEAKLKEKNGITKGTP
jgi:hypothetical protein